MRPSFMLLAIVLLFSTMNAQSITKIESLQSLYIEISKKGKPVGRATGFIIRSKTQIYLVTNYHVLTNRNPMTHEWIKGHGEIQPDSISIVHHAPELGKYIMKKEPLFDEKGRARWFEHTIGKEFVDVVEIPLSDTIGIATYPVNYTTSAYDNVELTPTDRVYILGFPLGLRSAPFLPIWKSGLLASEPDMDQDGKPIMWVDAATFPGMSGSPVYFMSNEAVRLRSGQSAFVRGASMFVGVFAYKHELDVYGALWKATFLKGIFDKLP